VMKAKPVIVIVITLIIGFVLGMLTSAQIRYHKLRPVSVYFSAERFRDGFYKTIEPDDKQKEKIEQVLNKYAKINSDLQNNFRKDLDETMIEFRKEIDSNLSKEQLARLKEMDDKRMEMIRQTWKNHENDTLRFRNGRGGPGGGPGPGGRPFQDGRPPQRPPRDSSRLPAGK
jgi:hypothetical protein